MLVEELMTTPVATVPTTTSLREASTRMLEEGVGSVLVVSEEESEEPLDATPTGILTKTDVLAAANQSDEPLSRLSVTDAASRPLVTTEPNRTVKRALELMSDNVTKHLVVVDDLEPVGMLTVTDIAIHHDEIRNEAMELVSKPLTRQRQ
jgi:CBS domain-containing protein